MTKDQIKAILALHKDAVNNAKKAYKEAENNCRENTFMDSGEADSYIKYVEGIEDVMEILDIPFPDWDFDEDDDMDFDDAMDILNELELDDTSYDYYKEALEGIHYNDQASHETHGYESLSAVIADARHCSEINKPDLPDKVTLNEDVVKHFEYDDGDVDDESLQECIDNYLSDEYGYCIDYYDYKCEYNVNGKLVRIHIYNIDWDLSE